MRTWRVFVAAVFVCMAQASLVAADEVAQLKEQLTEQSKLLGQMQEKLEQMEADQAKQKSLAAAQVAPVSEGTDELVLPEGLKWIENITWGGDLRYRHESIDDDTKSTDRDRHRIRARLKMKAKVNDEWDAIFRLASGSSDSPTSTNQTLGDSASDSFSSKEIWLDWAYADYHPACIEGLNVLLGKMGNPFYRVGKNQLIFDGDLSPEGGAATYEWDFAESTSAKLAGGAYWVSERSTDADTSIFGAQGMVKHTFSDSHVLGGVSYYDFGNIEGQSLSGVSAKGNTLSNGVFANDYDIVEAFGEYGFAIADIPVAVYGSYVNNTAASSSQDTGWLVGAKLNKAKKPGSWEASYNYRDVEADAVVGGINDSDFIGGGTDGTGHVLGFKYQLAKHVQAAVHYFLNEKNASSTEDDFRLLQADLVLKF